MEPKAADLPSFVDLLLDAVFLVEADGRIANVSAACERIFGYRPDEMIGRLLMDFIDPADRERTMAEARKVMDGAERIGFENRYIRKDGSRVHLMWSARWSAAEQKRIGVARDISEKKRADQLQAATYAISESAHRASDLPALYAEVHRALACLAPVAGLAVAIVNPMTRQLAFRYQADEHGEARILCELAAAERCAEVLREARHLELPARALLDTAIAGKDGDWLLLPLVAQDESIGVLALQGQAGSSYSEQDKELLRFVSAQVATAIQRRQMTEDLLHSAQFDELTGLPNRRHFHERMKAALARCKRKQRRLAVLFVDIDGFKQVNDTYGHSTGDQLLQQFAQRLKQNMRQDDSVARLGGDEFVILLEEIDQHADATAVANKIRQEMALPFEVERFTLRTGASIGMALYPEHGEEIAQLLGHADKLMYQDKRTHVPAPGPESPLAN